MIDSLVLSQEIRKEAEDLSKFLDDVRSGGHVEEREVFRFARFFNDEVTIDGAVRYVSCSSSSQLSTWLSDLSVGSLTPVSICPPSAKVLLCAFPTPRAPDAYLPSILY